LESSDGSLRAPADEQAGVHRIVTADQPEAPPYFVYDAVLNSKERATLDEALQRELRPLELSRALELQTAGAQILDTREPENLLQRISQEAQTSG